MNIIIIGWLVVVVNGALVGLNTYHMFRLRRERHRLAQLQQQSAEATAAFKQQVMNGEVTVLTHDGQIGMLVINRGDHGLQMTIEPFESEKVH